MLVLLLNSGIRQQRWHRPAAVMGDPGLLQELPDIPALLPEGGGDREQSAAADGTAGGLDAKADCALDDRLAQCSLGGIVGGFEAASLCVV